MGVRTLLTELRNLVTGKSFEVWEEADGNLTAKLGDGDVVTSITNPLTGGSVIPGVKTTGQAALNVTLGDSRLANGMDDSASAAAAAANGALTQISEGDAYTSWGGPQYIAQFLAAGLVDVQDYAVLGSRIYPVLGRTDDVLTNQYPSAMASTDAFVLGTLLGSANDRAAAPVNAVADTLNAYAQIVRGWCKSGRRLEIVIEPPQRGAYWPANAPADWSKLVALQRQLAVEFPDLISLVDTSGLAVGVGVVYPLSDVKDPYYDDVHPKFRGAYLIGKGLHDGRVAKGWLPQNPVRAAINAWSARIAGNKATNPQMTGSVAGIGGGTGPTGWSVARTASNSWDKSYVVKGVPVAHTTATAFAAGDVVMSAAYPDYNYLCVVAGTTAGSIPALSQTAFATTVDGTSTWLTLPKCDDLYGVNAVLLHGVGTADNTRGVVQQDVALASTGFAVGDRIEASVFLAALRGFYGAQIELQAMTGTTKIRSTFGMLAGYMDTSAVVADGTVGKLSTCTAFVIPPGTDTIRIKAQAYSKNGRTAGLLFAAPELRKI